MTNKSISVNIFLPLCSSHQFTSAFIQRRDAESQLWWPPLSNHPAGQRACHSWFHITSDWFLHCPQRRAGERSDQPHTCVFILFGSRIYINQCVICCFPSPFLEFDDPSALVVLLEEELVVIDLQTPGWPTLPTPYLAPLHSSAITCSCHISSVPPKLWERLVNAGRAQQGRHHTQRVREQLPGNWFF